MHLFVGDRIRPGPVRRPLGVLWANLARNPFAGELVGLAGSRRDTFTGIKLSQKHFAARWSYAISFRARAHPCQAQLYAAVNGSTSIGPETMAAVMLLPRNAGHDT